jgi:hypothetical protein
MLGHTPFIDDPPYSLQTIKDNVRLMTPALIENIHKVVVRACLRDMGLEGKPLDVAADSFPCETDVHYPTDVTLLADAARTAARIASRLPGADGWRQLEHLNRQLKRSARACAKAGQGACKARDAAAKAEGKAASAKSAARRGGATGAKAKMAADAKAGADVRASKARARQTAACGKFLAAAGVLLAKVAATLAALADPIRSSGSPQAQFAAQEADRLMALGRMLADQVRRRIINGESIRQEEKIFSVFEPHTEWIAKGKAGTPQQMGVNVCVASGPRGLILSTIVMFKVSDAKVAVEIAEKVKDVVGPALHSVSYDKGFWSPDNHEKLAKIVPLPVLPKKGGRGEAVRQREEAAPFKARRKAHAVVESSIAALQKHGLCRCLDHGKDGLSRAVALGALARNLQILGRFQLDREAKSEAKSKAIKAGLARRRLAAEAAAGAATAA